MKIRRKELMRGSALTDTDFVIEKTCNVHGNDEKTLSSRAEEQLKTLQIENAILKENKIIRRILICFLSLLSSSWLLFTGYEIRQLAKLHHHLPSSVAIAFITTSLATVVSLWAIGLNYFFYRNRKK